MLSPENFHRVIPRDYAGNLRWRAWLLERCRWDGEMRKAVRWACRSDILFYINTFVFQYNPLKKADRLGPFVTWPFQERALLDRPGGILWCYERDRTAVVEKSRDMGATWLFEIAGDWLCGFFDDVQVLDISRSADAVDSASKNSLFAKVRFVHQYLPDWLMGPIVEQKMNFSYGRTRSEKTGEASTGRSGSGGRASVAFIDEFSEIKEDAKVRQNTASIADCRFFNGTHLDVGTEFYQLTQTPEIVKIQMHWTRHPRKNRHLYLWDGEKNRAEFWRYDEKTDAIEPSVQSRDFPEDYKYDTTGKPDGGPHPGIRSPWYDKKVIEIGDERRAAMELDINPTGAASQFYNALVIRRLMAKCRLPEWRGEIRVFTETAKPRELDPDPNGPLHLWFEPGLMTDGKLGRTPSSWYVIGGDIGTGRGATPSCLTVFDVRMGAKVAKYVDYWKDPKEMARVAVGLAHLFHDPDGTPAYLVWETPGVGLVFGDAVLKDFHYRNIFWRTDPFRDDEKVSDIPGWNASPASKGLLHGDYRTALGTNEFTNPDLDSLTECLAYVHKNGSVEHPKAMKNIDAAGQGTNHGDHVVADALAWMLSKRKPVSEKKDEEPPPSVRSIAGRRLYNKRLERDADIWV